MAATACQRHTLCRHIKVLLVKPDCMQMQPSRQLPGPPRRHAFFKSSRQAFSLVLHSLQPDGLSYEIARSSAWHSHSVGITVLNGTVFPLSYFRVAMIRREDQHVLRELKDQLQQGIHIDIDDG